MNINLDDSAFSGGKLELTIESAVLEDDTWYNTTKVSILFLEPACPVTQSTLDAVKASQIVLEASQVGQPQKLDILSVIAEA